MFVEAKEIEENNVMGYDNGDLPFKGGASCVSLDTELLPSYSPVTSQKYEHMNRDIQKWW